MEPGEIIVVQLKSGPAIGRYLTTPNTPSKPDAADRIRVAIGRNREARLTTDRLLLSTGIVNSRVSEINDLWKVSKGLARDINLHETWKIASESRNPVSLDDLATLYWGSCASIANKIALIINVCDDNLYFNQECGSYYPRPSVKIEEIQKRRNQHVLRKRERASMVEALSRRTLPENLTDHQQETLKHLRGLAIQGNHYPRSAQAIDFLQEMHPNSKEFEKHAFRILVQLGLIAEDEPIELERAGYTATFPKAVFSESNAIKSNGLISDPQRVDLTKIPTLTIDEIGTYDRDDAISLNTDTDGNYHLGIHITDAGFLVPPDGAIDAEAKDRMSSIYLPTQILPMLPQELIADKGSLSKGTKRSALSILAQVSTTGALMDWNILRTVIESDDSLSYEDAEFALENPDHRWHNFISCLENISSELMSKRDASGAVDIQRPDMNIDVRNGDKINIRLTTKNRSRQIIAELMILYNTLIAEFCRTHSVPVIFRSQPPPTLISRTEGIEEGPYLWYMKMQHLLPAEFSTTPDSHHSLGVEHYSQVSAPLRRYTDLIAQRQIGHYLNSGQLLYSVQDIASIGQRGSIQLREIAGIEDSVKRYWFLKFLANKIATTDTCHNTDIFPAVILEKSGRRPALLELSQYPFRFRATIPDNSSPGDVVVLKLQGIDLWYRSTQFTYVRMG